MARVKAQRQRIGKICDNQASDGGNVALLRMEDLSLNRMVVKHSLRFHCSIIFSCSCTRRRAPSAIPLSLLPLACLAIPISFLNSSQSYRLADSLVSGLHWYLLSADGLSRRPPASTLRPLHVSYQWPKARRWKEARMGPCRGTERYFAELPVYLRHTTARNLGFLTENGVTHREEARCVLHSWALRHP